MPKFFVKNLLSPNEIVTKPTPTQIPNPFHLEPEKELPTVKESLLPSPLDTPELPIPKAPVLPTASPSHTETQPAEHEEINSNMVKLLLEWHGPSRPYRKKDRSFYTTIAILITLVSLIAILAGEKMLIAAILGLGFVVYVLNFIPPEEVHYKISTQGVTISDHFYHWQELDSFWFSNKEGFRVLNVLTGLRFPGMLMMVFNEDVKEDEVKRVCAKFLPFHEIAPRSMMDKWSEYIQKHFPMENPHH